MRWQVAGPSVVIVGGTGLYFTALVEGLAEVPEVPAAVRAEGDALRSGDFPAMVAGLDAATAVRIDLRNPDAGAARLGSGCAPPVGGWPSGKARPARR